MLTGACQFSTAWAGLRLKSFIHSKSFSTNGWPEPSVLVWESSLATVGSAAGGGFLLCLFFFAAGFLNEFGVSCKPAHAAVTPFQIITGKRPPVPCGKDLFAVCGPVGRYGPGTRANNSALGLGGYYYFSYYLANVVNYF